MIIHISMIPLENCVCVHMHINVSATKHAHTHAHTCTALLEPLSPYCPQLLPTQHLQAASPDNADTVVCAKY